MCRKYSQNCDDGQAREGSRLHMGNVPSFHLVMPRAIHWHPMRLLTHVRTVRSTVVHGSKIAELQK